MNRKLQCVFLIFLVVVMTHVASPSVVYTGGLSSAAGGISGTGQWIDDGVSIDWTVSQNPDLTWHYEYVFDAMSKNASHIIIEVSQGFIDDDLLNAEGPFTDIEIALHGPSPCNPNIPGNIYGIKFDSTTGATVTINFDSLRMPVWGDFYTKNGKSAGVDNSAWNAGFVNVDPDDLPANGTIDNHLLVPDTCIPEPGTLVLLGLGRLFLRQRRRCLSDASGW